MARIAAWIEAAIVFLMSLLFAAGTAAGQAPGIQAGYDAYRLAEEQRRNNVAAQSDLVEGLRYQAAFRPVYADDTIYWRSPYGSPYGAIGYGYSSPWGYRRSTSFSLSIGRGGFDAGSFSPVVGYVQNPNIPFPRQPIGQRQIQTGPNRWESYPVYADDPPELTITPPVVVEELAPPVRPKVSTPREY